MMTRSVGSQPSPAQVAVLDDEGSAGYSTLIVVLSFFALLGLGVAGMRVFTGSGDLQAAAQSAARAAALEHDLGDAQAAAQTVAMTELDRADEACESPSIQVSAGNGGFEPGGSVRIDMTCTVSYQGLWVPFMGSSRPVSVSAIEPIDCLRGGGSGALSLADNCYYGG